MNIVITGSSGFLGKHLSMHLSKKYDLVELDRMKLAQQISHNKINNFDVIIHCAARAHVMKEDSLQSWEKYCKSNIKLTIDIAKNAALNGAKRFIFISSLKVNGEKTDKFPFKASDPRNPLCHYSKSKALAEQELIKIGQQSGMEIVIIRPPLVYGKGVKANFGRLFNLVSKQLPLPFASIKYNRRSLVSVYNLVDLIDECIENPNAANEIFLVSDDNDLSTERMIRIMGEVLNKRLFLIPIPLSFFKLIGRVLNKSDLIDRLTDSLQADISQTKSKLNWKPPFSVRSGFFKCRNGD